MKPYGTDVPRREAVALTVPTAVVDYLRRNHGSRKHHYEARALHDATFILFAFSTDTEVHVVVFDVLEPVAKKLFDEAERTGELALALFAPETTQLWSVMWTLDKQVLDATKRVRGLAHVMSHREALYRVSRYVGQPDFIRRLNIEPDEARRVVMHILRAP